MRRHHPPYELADMQARVLERLEAGMTVAGVARLAGFPSKHTLYRWGWEDAGFAARMARAQAWGRGVRQGARNAEDLYDEARAQAFLVRVRLGDPVKRLVRTKGWPSREALNLWKRMRPDFAAALVAAAREARASRPTPFPYDEAMADAIVLACLRGGRLRDVLKAPGMPSGLAVKRWRKARPEFAGALRSAQLGCLRVRREAQRRDTPQVIAAVEGHVMRGGSLHSAGRLRGLPSDDTLYGWMKTRPEFARRVGLAQTWRDEVLLDRALMIAEDLTPETVDADAKRLAAIRQRAGQLGVGRGSH